MLLLIQIEMVLEKEVSGTQNVLSVPESASNNFFVFATEGLCYC